MKSSLIDPQVVETIPLSNLLGAQQELLVPPLFVLLLITSLTALLRHYPLLKEWAVWLATHITDFIVKSQEVGLSVEEAEVSPHLTTVISPMLQLRSERALSPDALRSQLEKVVGKLPLSPTGNSLKSP
jgi:hypothetical protein